MDGELKSVLVVTAVTRQGAVFLWPLALPGADGRMNDWWKTARQAAELAKSKWVRVAADMALGAYRIQITSTEVVGIPTPVGRWA